MFWEVICLDRILGFNYDNESFFYDLYFFFRDYFGVFLLERFKSNVLVDWGYYGSLYFKDGERVDGSFDKFNVFF